MMSIAPAFCEQHGEVEPCLTCKKEKEPQTPKPKRVELISEREMWRLIRAAILGIAAAIEKRYGFRKQV